jgi:polar amino acid transport system substrate-binding protein
MTALLHPSSGAHHHRARAVIAGLVAAVAAAVALSSCSSSSSSSATSSTSASAAASAGSPRAMLPASVRSSGALTIVSDTSFGPPWDFNPSNDPSVFDGIDPDLARAFASTLGVQLHWSIAPFDTIIPALMAGRYDLSMNGITDTAAREQQVDMIHYVNDSDTIVVAKNDPLKITGLASLCGRTVAAATGTHEADIVQQYQSQCGSKKMNILLYPSNGPTFLAVESGRAAATINGYAATFYLQDHKSPGFTGLMGLAAVRLGANPQGIAVPKDQAGIAQAITAALNEMIANGTYQKILAKWGIASNAIPKAVINAQS